ncbi:MAG: carbon-nitrogen hydrolase family protein [Lachnospiraceae bacterium]|nr:carbon-nitrogen hydrolase family protein [Lachnospiraceae bacterium]
MELHMKIAQIQTNVYKDKKKNLENLEAYLRKIAPERPDLAAVGEMFSCPYATENFPVYAEKEGGETWTSLSELAAKYQIYLSAGSVPEVDDQGKVYNTAYVFDRQGRQIAKHRKMHLFDIAIQGGQYFRESDTLTAGNQVTVLKTEFGMIGLCICFDFRFPELARLMVDQGAKVILVPAAFNMTTGPRHWELMHQSRALDNQCFVVSTSPARDANADYVAWGHSLIVSPWGDVIAEMDEREGYIITEIDLNEVDTVRGQLPLLQARRKDIYDLHCIE